MLAWRKIVVVLSLACIAILPLRAWDFIVLAPDSPEELIAAVTDLADALELADGTRPQVIHSRWRFPQNALFVGDTPVTVAALRLPRNLTEHGSISRRGPGERVYLRARNAKALVDGVYGMALEWAGARWYWPGDLGLVVSDGKGSGIFNGFARRLDEPAFIHRSFWPGGRVEDEGAFGRRNRLRGDFRFNHALASVFTPELFDERPELFATRNGRQQRPRGSGGTDPQPHLASQATARHAADAVLTYFAENPDAISFSLSINDNILFDDTELTRALVEPISYFRNKPNYTDLVFTFMNRVAHKVFDEGGAWETKTGQPRYLTALAYYWAEQSPSFPVHPRVVPILTADRAQWHDPAFRAEDMALIERWGQSGAELVGTWDYLFGGPYPYPRQFNRHLVDSIRHMANNNVQVYFAQLPFMPGWDGIKLHLAARLLWSPDADAEAIISAFYDDFFGPAAELLREYFEAFEHHRDQHEGVAEWIKLYKDEAAVELFSPDFLKQREQELIAALELVDQDSRYAQRIAIVQRELAFTLAYQRFQLSRREVLLSLAAADVTQADVAQARIQSALKAYRQERKAFNEAREAFAKLPYYARHVRWMEPRRNSDPTLAALGALQALGWEREPEELGVDEPERIEAFQRLRNAGSVAMLEDLVINPYLHHLPQPAPERFLFPTMPNVFGWFLDLRPSQGAGVDAVDEGDWKAGVRFSNVDAASLFSDIPVEENSLLLLETTLRYRASPDGRIYIEVAWSDDEGNGLGIERLANLPVDWRLTAEPVAISLRVPLVVPDKATNVRLRASVSRQFEGDFFAVESFSLVRIEE